MTRNEIKKIMRIARPAIIALYGRQSLKLIKYCDTLAYRGQKFRSVWLTIEGDNGTYKALYENGEITSLEMEKNNATK